MTLRAAVLLLRIVALLATAVPQHRAVAAEQRDSICLSEHTAAAFLRQCNQAEHLGFMPNLEHIRDRLLTSSGCATQWPKVAPIALSDMCSSMQPLIRASRPVTIAGFSRLAAFLHNISRGWLNASLGEIETEFQTSSGCDGAEVIKYETTVSRWLRDYSDHWKLDQLTLFKSLQDQLEVWPQKSNPQNPLPHLEHELKRLQQVYVEHGLVLGNLDLHIGSDQSCHLPLHHDAESENLSCQISGDKTWFLFPPSASAIPLSLDNPSGWVERSQFCSGSVLTLQEFAVANTNFTGPIVVRVKQGDCLVLPRYWWHSTVYHSPSEQQRQEHSAAATGLSIGFSSQFRYLDNLDPEFAKQIKSGHIVPRQLPYHQGAHEDLR